jgi:Common central domain of tyrosinase
MNFFKEVARNMKRFARASTQGNEESLHFAMNMACESTLGEMSAMLHNIFPSGVNAGKQAGYNKYHSFATDRGPPVDRNATKRKYPVTDQPAGSLEYFHNIWHIYIGSFVGHMGLPAVAAFNPIFFVHHW